MRVSMLVDGTSKRVLFIGGMTVKALGSSNEHAPKGAGWDGPAGSYWYHTPGPGTYVPSIPPIPPIPGYDPTPDRTVHVRRGEMLKVEIKLAPKGS
ncbi:MAG: hypothetical protein ACI9HE_000468 [Planctomycetota bacterium]|jgi:hypothetical protein